MRIYRQSAAALKLYKKVLKKLSAKSESSILLLHTLLISCLSDISHQIDSFQLTAHTYMCKPTRTPLNKPKMRVLENVNNEWSVGTLRPAADIWLCFVFAFSFLIFYMSTTTLLLLRFFTKHYNYAVCILILL